jgi:threonine dehydrogenase-like Zn-dependent dehydrogenase
MAGSIQQPPHFRGTFAEYYYLQPGFNFKAPEVLSDEELAPINCALSQVTYGLHQAGLRFADAVVIQGVGGLGLNAIAVAREMGAGQIIAIDGVPARLKLAKEFGADETINVTELKEPRERVARVMELTHKGGADVVCELVGLAAVVPEGIEMVRAGGTYLEIGNISQWPAGGADRSVGAGLGQQENRWRGDVRSVGDSQGARFRSADAWQIPARQRRIA